MKRPPTFATIAFPLFFVLATLFSPLAADSPWGRDAKLADGSSPSCTRPQSGLQRLAKRLIGFHHCVISPADGPRSHFYPSSSCYTEQAIEQYGFVRGFLMGCDRLMRENSEEWIYPTCVKNGRCLKVDCP